MTSGGFLGGDSGEEELRHGTDRLPPRLRRPATVVLVAIAGLAVAWVTTRIDSGGGTSADPTSSASSSPSAAAPSTDSPVPGEAVPVPSGSIVVVPVPVGASAIPSCAAGQRCATTDALPAAVGAALRDNYPGARIVSSRTITRTVANRTTLVGRSITAVAGARRFQIGVGPYVMGPDAFDRTNSGTRSTVGVDSASAAAHQTVHVLLSEPRTARPNDLIVLRLARDPRLSALR